MPADERIERIPDAVRAVLADADWFKKSVLAAFITMVPYVGTVWVMGYGLHYQRAVAWGQGERLPEWRFVAPQLKTGLFALLVGLVYTLPITVVLMAVFLFGGAALAVGALAMEQPVLAIVLGVTAWMAYMLVAAVTGVVLLPIYAHVQLYDSIQAGFEFKRIYELVRANVHAFWTAVWRSLLINLASMTVMTLIGGVGAAAAAIAVLMLPEEWAGIAAFAMYPLQFVAIIGGALLMMPLTFAMQRLWGGYARAAYGLDALAHQQEAAV